MRSKPFTGDGPEVEDRNYMDANEFRGLGVQKTPIVMLDWLIRLKNAEIITIDEAREYLGMNPKITEEEEVPSQGKRCL